jgi:hypothetical protein
VAAGIPCEGYDTARIFLNSCSKHGNTQTHRFVPTSYTLAVSTGQETGTTPGIRNLDNSSASKDLAIASQALNSSALQSQCLDIFWTALLPNSQEFSNTAARYSTLGWTPIVQKFCRQDGLVRLALLANAMGSLGQRHGVRSLAVDGWRAYGKSLQILAASIPTMGVEKGDELLAAAQLLAIYEVC